jgi:SAM-dependent methyltransferase
VRLTPAPPPPDFRSSLAVSYDAVAARRDDMGEAKWRWPIAESFLATMRVEGKQHLLEIGAGVGFTAQWFAERDVAVVATDLSAAQVELCVAKGLDAYVRDMYDLGFPDESFDAVWAMNCVHHIPTGDFDDVLRGIASVMKPGGLFYLGVWGGRDMEGIYDDDFYPPPRFFAIRSDATLVAAVEQVFVVESFDTFLPDIDKDDDGLHMQSLVLRRP